MSDNTTLSFVSSAGITEDYSSLRRLGINYIARLSHQLWTDFNSHDPGITILEVLSYAIMDLGYRSSFEMRDLLTPNPLKSPVNANNPFGELQKDFFSASEILVSNPVSPVDFRKLFIHIPGVKNAWMIEAEDEKINERLPKAETGDGLSYKLGGLYKILVELEDGSDPDNEVRVSEIREHIEKIFYNYRSLGEDLISVEVVKEKPLLLKGRIEVDEEVDLNDIEAQIAFSIQEFLTPTIHFYSLGQMLENGWGMDEIFRGTIFPEELPFQGFLDDNELKGAKLRKQVYKSDLYQVILDIEGVKAINKLELDLLEPNDSLSKDEWYVDIRGEKGVVYKPVIDLINSLNLTYKKGDFVSGSRESSPFRSEQFVREKLTLLRHLNRKPLLDRAQDRAIQEGSYRDLEKYVSIQTDFPNVYRVDEGEITASLSEAYKARVKQLKAFLTIFDQILANYLADLQNIRTIFSLSQEPESQVHFYKNLRGIVPGIDDVLVNHYSLDAESLVKLGEPGVFYTKDHDDSKEVIIGRLSNLVPANPMPEEEFISKVKLSTRECFKTPANGENGKRGVAKKDEKDSEERFERFMAVIKDLTIQDKYEVTLKEIIHDESERKRVKNLVLNHLAARFGEQFTEYALLLYQNYESNSCQEPQFEGKNRLIKAKTNFLKNIPEMGRDRGKAMNHRSEELREIKKFYESYNISGLRKRVSNILGLDPGSDNLRFQRSQLSSGPKVLIIKREDSSRDSFNFVAVSANDDGSAPSFEPDTWIPLESVKQYNIRAKGLRDKEEFMQTLLDASSRLIEEIEAYEINDSSLIEEQLGKKPDEEVAHLQIKKSEVSDSSLPYRIALVTAKGDEIALGNTFFEERKRAVQELRRLVELVYPEKIQNEGFYVIEHILLRPFEDGIKLLEPFPVDHRMPSNSGGTGPLILSEDPYSFWISIFAMKAWPRFSDEEGRAFFEQTVRREAPAHMGIRFHWLSGKNMYEFEDAYLNWLYDEGRRYSDECQIQESMNHLIELLNKFNQRFDPEA
ncbi:MAG: hypothetical protein MRZ79_21755 [Bacteroidia bacterium]|nr:hypothetical protein [Bacteroidia bacterium]